MGREPKKSSRVPKATTIAATSPASARWRPVLRNDGAHLVPEPIATRTVAQIVQLVEVGVLAEGKADAPGQDGPLRHLLQPGGAAEGHHGVGCFESLM